MRRAAVQGAGLGLIILVLGSGVMSTISNLGPEQPYPGWKQFKATTIGDTVLLPILASSLYIACRGVGARVATPSFRLGASVGALGGIALQASWLIDPKPRLTWVLPEVHRFSWQGWYHGAFLVLISGLLVGLTARLLTFLWLARSTNPLMISEAARSPLMVVIVLCAALFGALVVLDGGAGTSRVYTFAAVILTVTLAVAAGIVILGRAAWLAIACGLICASCGLTLVLFFQSSPAAWVGATVSLLLAFGISVRHEPWLLRVAETTAVSLCLAAVLVLSIHLSSRAVLAVAVAACGVLAVCMGVTRLLPLQSVGSSPVDFRTASTAAALTAALPAAAWLGKQPPDLIQGYGNAVTIIVAAFFAPWLVPLIEQDMKTLMAMEAGDPEVTGDAQITRVATRITLRAASWGPAAVAILFTVVVYAGPSMGFADGRASVSVPWIKLMLAVIVSVSAAVTAYRLRARSWSPLIVCLAALLLTLLYLSETNWRAFQEFPVVLFWGILILLWQAESVVSNTAMRPAWAVRRPWRIPVGITLALAVSIGFAAANDIGNFNSSGSLTPILTSFAVMSVIAALNAVLVLIAGWTIDWRSTLGDMPPASGGASGPTNWARYRLRGSLFQDYGLMYLLASLGVWLPFAAVLRVVRDDRAGLASSFVLATTGMVFFSGIFVFSLQNSVQHVVEQSNKAGRPVEAWLFGTIPVVSRKEQAESLASLVSSADGPASQLQWASTLAAHQQRQNVLAIGLCFTSLAGVVAFVAGRRSSP